MPKLHGLTRGKNLIANSEVLLWGTQLSSQEIVWLTCSYLMKDFLYYNQVVGSFWGKKLN